MGTNPAVSLPDADAARAALKKLELFVVSENVGSNDTVNAGAHVLLPAQAWGEKSGTVTNSERRISRQRAFLTPPGETRPDWWIVGEVAKRLGFGAAFDFQFGGGDLSRTCRAVGVREQWRPRFRHRRVEIVVGRGVRYAGAGAVAACASAIPSRSSGFSADGGFFANDHKARFVAPEVPALRTETTAGRPLRLNTGRIRDQWHTMTRSGTSPRLGQHLPEPFVEVHPDDAARTRCGRWRLRARRHRLRPMHSQGRGQRAAAARHAVRADPLERGDGGFAARVGALVAPLTDPFSGQPENKATPASITPYEYVFRGFALSRAPLELARSRLVGARDALAAATAICSPTTRTLRDGRRGCARSQAAISPNTGISAVVFIARHPLPPTGSKPACSSDRRGMPATGTS